MGVTIKKNIMLITIGEIKLPRNNPNLNQIKLRGLSNFELIIPKIKKIIDVEKNHKFIFSPFFNGHNEIIKKNMKKTIPKLLFDPNLIFEFFIQIVFNF